LGAGGGIFRLTILIELLFFVRDWRFNANTLFLQERKFFALGFLFTFIR